MAISLVSGVCLTLIAGLLIFDHGQFVGPQFATLALVAIGCAALSFVAFGLMLSMLPSQSRANIHKVVRALARDEWVRVFYTGTPAANRDGAD